MNFLISLLIIFLMFNINVLLSQTFIDTIYSYQWGKGTQTIGRDAKYFPQNIFGPPTYYATKYSPAIHDSNVVSLGIGGEIIVGCKDCIILNKKGPDFIIFENVFSNYSETKIFGEPAIISVSKDGINFVEFPYNSTTLEGLAGVNWTNGSENCFDYLVSGGDAFDLEDIGMDSIRYIKIKDTSLIVSTLPTNHKYYSPAGLLTGFDLDAVVLLHTNKSINDDILSVFNVDGNYYLDYKDGTKIAMFDIFGSHMPLDNYYIITKNKYPTGVYFIKATYKNNTKILKIIFD